MSRVVYLGGLGRSGPGLSRHLRSRHEVGEALRAAGVPVIELRASIVIGCGSVSFEMIRALVERLPVMITPRWVDTHCQPIGAHDLIRCLLAAIDLPPGGSRILEIGGADRVSYGQIMEEYARQRGLRRCTLKVPLLTPRLSSLWLGLVTPFHARVGRSLVDSLRNLTVVNDPTGLEALGVRPAGIAEAIAATLQEEDAAFRASRWSSLTQPPPLYLVEQHRVDFAASPDRLFEEITRLGGRDGWRYADWLWRLRGALDRVIGGVGLRRSRSPRRPLRVGDTLDFWRVEEFHPGRRLRLAAEMRVPGRAWLELEVEDAPAGRGSIKQPSSSRTGYWVSPTGTRFSPSHRIVFRGMLQAISRTA